MIVILKNGTPQEEITRLSEEISDAWGVTVEKSVGKHKIVLAMIGDTPSINPLQIKGYSTQLGRPSDRTKAGLSATKLSLLGESASSFSLKLEENWIGCFRTHGSYQ